MTNPSDLVRDELPGDPVPATWATATAEQKKLVILEALKEVVDPELMVNVVDLGSTTCSSTTISMSRLR